ncbi:FKBP-type peptidyl-prolyl cis-trans isomerase N-terminal domain-containing protein [Serratia entomophila]|uniref:FKBP-type peptidyl-prolyl cis-trans isomerase N-terminal domain-containing protein n=1 Tax=Serratia entomophila TaxID=42906 RepID=UPI0021779E04|nr:FKBP-type peptidyl-prolyl cis-trans isomerase N-terminal domain-containing protein [Serratia entomophila]CAI1924489.1 FKBP-type peptidyl-prolyl cis-trans isomerase fkpA precursor [Serratia entomophila]
MTLSRLNARLRQLAVLLPLLWGTERAQADEGIPALLQFAEQYRDTQHADVPEKPAKTATTPAPPAPPKTARPATAPATLSDSPTLRRALQARDAQLAKQQTLLQRQEKELARLRQSLAAETARHQQAMAAAQSPAQTAATGNPAGWAPLQKLVSGLRQAASGMPDEQRATALTARLEKEKAALTARLSTKEEQRTTLEEKAQDMQVVIEQKEATLSALRLENTALQERQTTLKEQAGKAEAQLAEQAQTLNQAQVDVAALQGRAKWLAKPQALSKPAGQQAYAAGGALGRDILAMLNERKGWGIDMERQTVLAGVVDAFAGQYQLTTDVLTRALAESEAAVNTARAKAIAGQQKKGESFVADFKKQTGVKQSPAGFWYRVDYAGDAPLRDADIVDVVVKEALTDGTVIQDMSLSGNVLSQPLSAYPPLFREAIGHLKNHGSLTMVVPPALAYGEDGYPPKVPPNATMVYELRIDNSKAAPGA